MHSLPHGKIYLEIETQSLEKTVIKGPAELLCRYPCTGKNRPSLGTTHLTPKYCLSSNKLIVLIDSLAPSYIYTAYLIYTVTL